MEKGIQLAGQIENELRDYFNSVVYVSPDNSFSQPKLVRRISLFENRIYPGGKIDKQGNYKFWFDIISPRILGEVKNVDFDAKDVDVYSERKIDELPVVIVNLKLRDYLRDEGQGEEFNSAIEEFSGWGNVVWKKVNKGYERVDLKNLFVINQTAKDLTESAVIERYQYQQADLRAKKGIWEGVDEVIKEYKSDFYAPTVETQGKQMTTPFYDIYERNGEVCLKDLKDFQGKKPVEGDDNRYVLAKVIGVGMKGTGNNTISIERILFADTITKMPYKEAHRGAYKGRWMREGLYELLFDLQIRANNIGNQLSLGLEWASKIIFFSNDKLIVQNIMSDLKNGDIIRAQNVSQLPVQLQGLTALIEDWNRIIKLADDLANSLDVVMGETPKRGYNAQAISNQNANKVFDFIREKLGVPLSDIFREWVIPNLVNELKAKEILRLTGDSKMMDRFMQLIVDNWYLASLEKLPMHTQDQADALKARQLDMLKKRPNLLITGLKKVFDGFKAEVSVSIKGENSKMPEEIQTIMSFVQLESDPVRRTALIEMAMAKKGLDVAGLPKSQPGQLPQSVPTPKRKPRATGAPQLTF